VRCPQLAELPSPQTGKTGWPWTEEAARFPDHGPDGKPWPRLTIVTPSFNQGRFIEETIRSILLQGYPNLEYFVLDGGSTDQTVEIIEKYSPWIDFWVSERDSGQSAAINRGLRKGTGLCATWINSDDMLCQGALSAHFRAYSPAEDVIYVGDCVNIDESGQVLFTHRGRVHSFEDLVRVREVWQSGYICQQAVLFPLPLFLRAGGLNESNHYCMDYELWGRFLLAGARVLYTGIPFGYFRLHQAQKTRETLKQIDGTLDAAVELLAMDRSLPPSIKQTVLSDLHAYRQEYPEIVWKHSGRLSRLGLPKRMVAAVRHLKRTVDRLCGR
jgi:hypothetical protein